MKYTTVFLAFSASVFLSWGTPLPAHFDAALDIPGMTIAADFVFRGIVVNIDYKNSEAVPLLDPDGIPIPDENGDPAFVDGSDLPHTFVTYQVEQVYKGPRASPTELTLRFEGGATNELDPEERSYLLIESYPLFKIGDRDILFVQDNAQYPCPLAGCSSGRLRILSDSQFPDNNFLFSDTGMEIRVITPPDGGPAQSCQIVFGPQHIRPEITSITFGDLELDLVFVNPTEGILPPPADNPRGERFTEVQFDNYLTTLVGELFTPDELHQLPPIADADSSQPFQGYAIEETPDSPAVPPDPCESGDCEPERPWLAELMSPRQLAALLEAERLEREWLVITDGNPVLPQTPCQQHIALYGALPGDISGPDAQPDCIINMYDFVVIAAGWLECIDDGNGCI